MRPLMRRRRFGLAVGSWLALAVGALATLVLGVWVNPLVAAGVGLIVVLVAAAFIDLVSR